MNNIRETSTLVIGAFDVDIKRNRIFRGHASYAIEPQIMDLFCALAEKPGEVFSRAELIDKVWSLNFGGDESLTRAVSILRKTFKKAGEEKPYIETIYRRGYRLLVPVSKKNPIVKNTTISGADKTEIASEVLAYENISHHKDQAYDYFMHGRGLTQQQDGPETLPKAIEMLEKSVSLDPEFAEAWAYLARANFYSLEHTKAPNWTDHIVAGRRAVTRALDLNPNLGIAHSTAGYLALLDLDVYKRLTSCEKAHQLNPNFPVFTYTFGSALASIGQSKRGLKLMQTALKQEPLRASWINGIGHPKFAHGDFDGAAADYQHSFELGYDSAMFMRAILLTHMGRPKEAGQFLKHNLKFISSLLSDMLPSTWILNLNNAACCDKNPVARGLLYCVLAYLVNSKKTQPTTVMSFRCYALGYPKLFMKSVRDHPHPYLGATLAQLWTPTQEARRIRTHKDFPKFADDIGLVRAWQAYGWPKTIQPIDGKDGSNGQFICS